MRIKVLAGHANLYQRNQVPLRYLRSLICVTKSSIVFLKRGKTERELSMFFFIMIADAICLLTAVAHALFFSYIITIKLFWRVSLRHLSFVTSTHAIWLLGAFNTCFLSFSQVSVCHLSLSRVSASYISLGCGVFFSSLAHSISFCWVTVSYVSFFYDSRWFLSFLGTSIWYLSLVALVLAHAVCLLCFELIGPAA